MKITIIIATMLLIMAMVGIGALGVYGIIALMVYLAKKGEKQ